MFNFIGVCCGMMWQGCYSILWPSCCLAKDYVLLYFYTFHSLTTIMFLQSNEPIIKEFQDNVCNFLVRFACLVQDYGQNQQVLNASSVYGVTNSPVVSPNQVSNLTGEYLIKRVLALLRLVLQLDLWPQTVSYRDHRACTDHDQGWQHRLQLGVHGVGVVDHLFANYEERASVEDIHSNSEGDCRCLHLYQYEGGASDARTAHQVDGHFSAKLCQHYHFVKEWPAG